MSKHTPGPWKAEANGGRIVAANGDIVAPWVLRDSRGGIFAEEREANARLIAAAPALLEALQNLVAQLTKYGPYWFKPDPEEEFVFETQIGESLLNQARAAIAEAETGETK